MGRGSKMNQLGIENLLPTFPKKVIAGMGQGHMDIKNYNYQHG